MNTSVFFLNMFSAYQPPEHLQTVLSQAAVAAAEIDPVSRQISVTVSFSDYITDKDLDSIALDIAEIYGLYRVELSPIYPQELLQKMPEEALMGLFMAQDSMARASLSGAKWTWEEQTLHIQLLGNGKDDLLKCVPGVVRKLEEMFDTQVQVEIHSGENLTGQALFDAMAKMRGSMMKDLPKVNFDTAKKEQKQETSAIYGRPFKNPPRRYPDRSGHRRRGL